MLLLAAPPWTWSLLAAPSPLRLGDPKDMESAAAGWRRVGVAAVD